MRIQDTFRVAVPIEQAWEVLLDIERIAPCLPGAQLQEIDGDEYRGAVRVKVGPITAAYKGSARLEQVDPVARTIVIRGVGRDTRGAGNASATINVAMSEDGDGTQVSIDTDLAITGKVAQFGRGVLADVSAKLLARFVENLERDVLASAASGVAPVEPVEISAVVTEVTGAGEVRTATATAVAQPPSGPRRIDGPVVAPVDLLDAAGGSVAKRTVPTVVVLLAVFLVWRLVRRRRSRRRTEDTLAVSLLGISSLLG